MALKEDSVMRGFDHLENIAALHFHRSPEEQMEAMTLVMESFGMDEEARDTLTNELETFVPERARAARGWVMMGFLAGLSAAQDAAESD